eukprot:TRINITY_DN12078_c0_g1_i1.p1 TRINITY_DN12078_c0_g1~~TRINITY_DN12078_c0_g1_i1.p1  ORF type:complete len:254 (+),score=63.62 TRINITY_DN12078_c0_g1_i1:221-982(+)
MTSPPTSEEALSDLLDSALDDFGSLESNSSLREDGNVIVQGLGTGLPSPPGKKKGKQKAGVSENMSQATAPTAPSAETHVAETLERLAQQTKETLKGMESAMPKDNDDDLGGEKMVENLLKKFEELGGSQDMQTVVDTMMHQLLSKEILYEPMKEIGEKYPQWLEAKKSSLSKEDFTRYTHQHSLIKQLCCVYETEPENFEKIVDLMQKMQDCGQPPNDIVKELTPGFELENQGMPGIGELLGDNSTSNCSIM